VPSKVPGKLKECNILFTDVVQNADRGLLPGRKPDDIPSRPSKLPLQRLYLRGRSVKMLLKKLLENVHNRRSLSA
jgi:hypothetical protein